jgi:beta-phosphoglucomutase-like phosphatase (HAD superfamily)
MIEKAPTSKEKENVDNKKSELNSLKAEIADADLASNKKSELTQKVDEFLNKLEKTTDLASLSNSMNELINTIKNEILNSEIEKIKDKKLNILNFDEAKLFAYSIFGTGP